MEETAPVKARWAEPGQGVGRSLAGSQVKTDLLSPDPRGGSWASSGGGGLSHGRAPAHRAPHFLVFLDLQLAPVGIGSGGAPRAPVPEQWVQFCSSSLRIPMRRGVVHARRPRTHTTHVRACRVTHGTDHRPAQSPNVFSHKPLRITAPRVGTPRWPWRVSKKSPVSHWSDEETEARRVQLQVTCQGPKDPD